MKLRRTILLASMVLVIAALSPAAAGAAKGGTNRPFKGSGAGSGLAAADGTYVIDATGNYSHLGRTKIHVEGVCTDADCTTSTFTFTDTAANGDKVTGTSTSSDDGTGHFTNHDTVTGGTGRFAGASGQQTTTGVSVSDPSNPAAFQLKFKTVGTISY